LPAAARASLSVARERAAVAGVPDDDDDIEVAQRPE